MNKITRHSVLLVRATSSLFAVLLATGCQTLPNRAPGTVAEHINTALHPAAPVAAAALPQPFEPPPATAPNPTEHRLDLAANNTPAREVFMSLVEGTPYSMVVQPDLTGQISLQLKNVTIEEALDTLRRVYGYDYRREGKRYHILGQGLQTHIFPVNYLHLNRKGRSDTRVSSGELAEGSSSSTASSTGGSSRPKSPDAYGIQVETLSDSNFWRDIAESLSALIGTEDGRRVVVNASAGIIIVRARPTELALVDEFLGLTQTTLNRQVVLEAKIIEVELNDGFQSGINWAALGKSGSVEALASQTGGGTIFSGTGTSEIAGNVGNLDPGSAFSPVDSAISSAFGGVFSLALKGRDFSAFVELLKTQGNVQVLSSPRVSTVNNQKAVIKVGGDEFFVTGITNTTTSSTTSTTVTPTVELTPFFSGIALDVTPQIDDRGNVILHIHPTVSDVVQRDKNFIVGGEAFSLPLAFSSIQESDNVVRAKGGEVIVIGGLMKEATTTENASVPLIGDLPIIGGLFKHQRLARVKKELVILLKPTVVDSGDVWAVAIDHARDRTDAMTQAGENKTAR